MGLHTVWPSYDSRNCVVLGFGECPLHILDRSPTSEVGDGGGNLSNLAEF